MIEKREISGFFLSSEKFTQHCISLASPLCTTTHLRLFHNEACHTEGVVRALASNTSVTSLDIYELDPSTAAGLGAVLATNPRISSLAIHHLQGEEAVRSLSPGLAANRSLNHLHFTQLDGASVAHLAAAIGAWTSQQQELTGSCRLQQLRLEKSSLTEAAAEALAGALASQGASLQSLELVECDVGEAAGCALLSARGWELLVQQQALRSLDLTSCNLGPKAAAHLGRLLSASRTLGHLNLSGNSRIGCAGATALAQGLSSGAPALQHLDLSGCGIGTPGVQAIAAALTANRQLSLQRVQLSHNAAGAAGLHALLTALSGPAPAALASLHLDANFIRGAELAQLLSHEEPSQDTEHQHQPLLVTAPLEQLSLATNSLQDAGATALATCLSAAWRLQQLDLRENGVADSGVAALLPLLGPAAVAAAAAARGEQPAAAAAAAAAGPRGPVLQGLLLDHNRLHNSGAQLLLEAVTAAPALWRFSAEANKLTDPALRASLTQLGQQRAARHSQLVVLGRHLTSSSSSSEDTDQQGGKGGAEAESRRRSSGGGGGNASGPGAGPAPMDLDGSGAPHQQQQQQPQGQQNGGQQPGQQHQQQQHEQQHGHKHSWEDCMDGNGGSSGDERPPLRNVVARSSLELVSEQGRSHGHGQGHGGHTPSCDVQTGQLGSVAVPGWSSQQQRCAGYGNGAMPPANGTAVDVGLSPTAGMEVPCLPGGGGGQHDGSSFFEPWLNGAAASNRFASSTANAAAGCHGRPSTDGDDPMTCAGLRQQQASFTQPHHHYHHHHQASSYNSPHKPTGGTDGGCRGGRSSSGGAATYGPAMMSCSPPPAMCYATAMTGVGGAGTVAVGRAQAVGGGSAQAMQQQASPPASMRKLRYKPLTPEQQALFADF